jgi:ethanolamine transporter EutH
MFFGTLIITLIVSVGINHTGIGTRLMSVRYSMIGFLIFLVFFTVTLLFFGAREINLVKRYAKLIKTLLVLGLCRWGIIWLMPNLLKFAGYNQFNYE